MAICWPIGVPSLLLAMLKDVVKVTVMLGLYGDTKKTITDKLRLMQRPPTLKAKEVLPPPLPPEMMPMTRAMPTAVKWSPNLSLETPRLNSPAKAWPHSNCSWLSNCSSKPRPTRMSPMPKGVATTINLIKDQQIHQQRRRHQRQQRVTLQRQMQFLDLWMPLLLRKMISLHQLCLINPSNAQYAVASSKIFRP